MTLATIKVDVEIRDRLAEVACSRHTTMRALLSDLVEQAARDQRWADIHDAYAHLQSQPERWAEYRGEIENWDSGGDVDATAPTEWPESSSELRSG